MPDFLKYLRRESRFHLFAGTLLAVVVGLVTWPLFLHLLDLYDSVVPIRERDALGWVLGVGVLSVFVFLLLFLRSCLKKPSSTEVARQVEAANPDLRDMLNCAVELHGKSGRRELTFMEGRVVRLAEEKAEKSLGEKGPVHSLVSGLPCLRAWLWEEFCRYPAWIAVPSRRPLIPYPMNPG